MHVHILISPEQPPSEQLTLPFFLQIFAERNFFFKPSQCTKCSNTTFSSLPWCPPLHKGKHSRKHTPFAIWVKLSASQMVLLLSCSSFLVSGNGLFCIDLLFFRSHCDENLDNQIWHVFVKGPSTVIYSDKHWKFLIANSDRSWVPVGICKFGVVENLEYRVSLTANPFSNLKDIDEEDQRRTWIILNSVPSSVVRFRNQGTSHWHVYLGTSYWWAVL